MITVWVLAACVPPPSPVGGGAITLDASAAGDADLRWYDVAGHDVRTLRESLRTEAPRNDLDEPTLGRTQWSATWRWEGAGEPCAVESVHVDLSLVVWLPRWTPGPGADPALIRRWRDYLRALLGHELGHVELVREQVEVLEDLLAEASCADVDTVGRVGVEAIEDLNLAYDAHTGHGRDQGARFWTAPEWGAEVEDTAPWAP